MMVRLKTFKKLLWDQLFESAPIFFSPFSDKKKGVVRFHIYADLKKSIGFITDLRPEEALDLARALRSSAEIVIEHRDGCIKAFEEDDAC